MSDEKSNFLVEAEELINKFCDKKVSKKEYQDFLDPIISTLGCQVASKGTTITIKFHYSLIDDEVLAIQIKDGVNLQYWLRG